MAHMFAESLLPVRLSRFRRKWAVGPGYSSIETGPDRNNLLRDRERVFIEARDSFYIASVSETGWPYIQHRGGPAGFLKVIDQSTIGFADYSGNRQYVTTGNVLTMTALRCS